MALVFGCYRSCYGYCSRLYKTLFVVIVDADDGDVIGDADDGDVNGDIGESTVIVFLLF